MIMLLFLLMIYLVKLKIRKKLKVNIKLVVKLVICDKDNSEYICEITDINKEQVDLDIIEKREIKRESDLKANKKTKVNN